MLSAPQTNSKNSDSDVLRGTVRDYVSLLKPRVISLVIFTAIAGVAIAPGEIHPLFAVCAVLAIAMAAGGAAAINMWYDSDIDQIMSRTQNRAIPSGRLPAGEALTFGVCMIVPAIITMWMVAGLLAAGLLAFSAFFYAVIYTIWLKRTTPQNIVIGGAAGSFPPMIGYVAVTGEIDLLSVVLFAIVFLWTPPHFWALSLYRRDDYAAANIPMLPVTHGERTTKWHMLIYTGLLFIAALVPGYLLNSPVYLGGSGLLGILFIISASLTLREDGKRTGYYQAKRMFRYSIFYLFAVFGLLMANAFGLLSFL